MTAQLPTPSSPFTPEQREILGRVYSLILSWRRERLIKDRTQKARDLAQPGLPAERGSDE